MVGRERVSDECFGSIQCFNYPGWTIREVNPYGKWVREVGMPQRAERHCIISLVCTKVVVWSFNILVHEADEAAGVSQTVDTRDGI